MAGFLVLKNDNFGFWFIKFTLFLLQAYTAAVVQWVRALAPQAEGWVFES